MEHTLYFDGSSLDRGRRGGPGPSSAAAVVLLGDEVLAAKAVFLPGSNTHFAEYTALKIGLDLARSLKLDCILALGDSLIVIEDVLGKKMLKDPSFSSIRDGARELLAGFSGCEIRWIPRRKNLLADELARSCLNRL